MVRTYECVFVSRSEEVLRRRDTPEGRHQNQAFCVNLFSEREHSSDHSEKQPVQYGMALA